MTGTGRRSCQCAGLVGTHAFVAASPQERLPQEPPPGPHCLECCFALHHGWHERQIVKSRVAAEEVSGDHEQCRCRKPDVNGGYTQQTRRSESTRPPRKGWTRCFSNVALAFVDVAQGYRGQQDRQHMQERMLTMDAGREPLRKRSNTHWSTSRRALVRAKTQWFYPRASIYGKVNRLRLLCGPALLPKYLQCRFVGVAGAI